MNWIYRVSLRLWALTQNSWSQGNSRQAKEYRKAHNIPEPAKASKAPKSAPAKPKSARGRPRKEKQEKVKNNQPSFEAKARDPYLTRNKHPKLSHQIDGDKDDSAAVSEPEAPLNDTHEKKRQRSLPARLRREVTPDPEPENIPDAEMRDCSSEDLDLRPAGPCLDSTRRASGNELADKNTHLPLKGQNFLVTGDKRLPMRVKALGATIVESLPPYQVVLTHPSNEADNKIMNLRLWKQECSVTKILVFWLLARTHCFYFFELVIFK